jgi:hypothetical protein
MCAVNLFSKLVKKMGITPLHLLEKATANRLQERHHFVGAGKQSKTDALPVFLSKFVEGVHNVIEI